MDHSTSGELSGVVRRLSRTWYRVAVLLLAGCGGRPDAPPPRVSSVSSVSSPLPQRAAGEAACRPPSGVLGGVVHSEDRELLTRVQFGRPACTRSTDHRLLVVGLPIENVSGAALRFAVQIEFLDGQRAFYGDRTTRRIMVLSPGERQTIRAASERSKASSFVVLLALP